METTSVKNSSELVNVAENAQIENSKKINEALKNKKEKKSVKVEKQKNVVTTKNGEVINANVAKLSYTEMLKNLNVAGLKTNSGLKKENLYLNSIYSDCLTDRDKKSRRRQVRNLLDNFIGTILRSKDVVAIKNHVKQFVIFYENTYRTNDFSISSLVSNNTEELKKENIQKMLELVKKYK